MNQLRQKIRDAARAFVLAWVLGSATQLSATTCADLTYLKSTIFTITSSTTIPAGRFTPPGSQEPLNTPEFCLW